MVDCDHVFILILPGQLPEFSPDVLIFDQRKVEDAQLLEVFEERVEIGHQKIVDSKYGGPVERDSLLPVVSIPVNVAEQVRYQRFDEWATDYKEHNPEEPLKKH